MVPTEVHEGQQRLVRVAERRKPLVSGQLKRSPAHFLGINPSIGVGFCTLTQKYNGCERNTNTLTRPPKKVMFYSDSHLFGILTSVLC